MALQLNHNVGSIAWWRGAITVLFGLTALWSGTFLTMLVLGLGVYALVDGLSVLIGRWLARSGRGHSWLLALRGAASIPIGMLVFIRPSATAPALLFAIVAWLMLTGMLDVVAMLNLRHTFELQQRRSWDGAVRRQRQMSWDGVIERKLLYARAEQMGWDNQAERKRRDGSTEGVANGLYVSPARYAAQSAGHQLWERQTQ